jgi:predicted MPP superfamily phosphohydrolase
LIVLFKFFNTNVLGIFNLNFSYFYVNLIAAFIFLFTILINIYGLYKPSKIKVLEKDIHIENLPTIWENKRAAFISDTHYGPIHGKRYAKKVVSIINKNNADYLFHSGDFYDGPKIDWAKPANEYKKINQNIKKYFVSGNHEVYAQSSDTGDDILKHIEEAGFIITNNKVTEELGVNIIGVDYARGDHKDEDMVKNIFESDEYKINRHKPSIVLKHVPINIKSVSDYGADLMLSGHTHNGQMFPFNYLTKYVYKGFHYGLKYEGDTAVYTTSGVGSWGPPQRIGTQSEIVFFTFKKK